MEEGPPGGPAEERPMQRRIVPALVLAVLVLLTLRVRASPWLLLVEVAAVIGLVVAIETRQRLTRAARARYTLARDRAQTVEALEKLDGALARVGDAPPATREAFRRAARALRLLDAAVRDDPA